ncbi:MAG: hypothetical protein WC953_11480 [Pseudomonas sp.]
MDKWPTILRTTGMLLLWLFSSAPTMLASATETPPARQVEFSDRNYQPGRHVNTSTPVKPVTPATARAAPGRDRRVVQSRSEKVTWTSARGTKQEYRVYYEYDGTHVTFASVCSNYRKGSINYRNCRKAAKQWFGTRCNNSNSTGRMYCHADNAFRP